MGARIRGVAVVGVVLVVGAFLGSALSQWSEDGWFPTGRGESPPEGVGEARGAQGTSGDAAAAVPRGSEGIRVEVLNGAGRSGMARSATERLRDRGFDVVYFGNASSFDHDSSRVVDRVDRPELARRVADALGIERVVSEPDSNLYLDATVVLGGDWREEAVAPAGPEGPDGPPAAPTAWWDLRRFLPGVPGTEGGEDGGPGRRPTETERMANPGADSVAGGDGTEPH